MWLLLTPSLTAIVALATTALLPPSPASFVVDASNLPDFPHRDIRSLQRKNRDRARRGGRDPAEDPLSLPRNWGEKQKKERKNLPSDSMLRIGVTKRPRRCPTKSKRGDTLKVHYNGTLYSDGSVIDCSIER
uniref:Peptidylprolyl isomerase n=1 Tax=Pseudictyota dubia TaxID=2749911 RepID=A0A7R9WDY4_9STRA|mmetsp:Transcript_43932/g.81703  ORF Transcript_43932/g.81703 Transcript_43932/m.81703 type:complete len:132 (+) Transcript_43932:35-430(+)